MWVNIPEKQLLQAIEQLMLREKRLAHSVEALEANWLSKPNLKAEAKNEQNKVSKIIDGLQVALHKSKHNSGGRKPRVAGNSVTHKLDRAEST